VKKEPPAAASICFRAERIEPVIEALDDEPLLHAVMGECRDIILQAFPCLGDGHIHELLNPRDLVPEGIGFAQWKKLGEKCIGALLQG
jgi:hypothetical protein